MQENPYGIDPRLIIEFCDESQELLQDATNYFIKLERDSSDKAAIDTVFRAVHTIKGNSAFFNLLKTQSLAHALEDLMSQVRDGKRVYTKPVADMLLRGIDELKTMLARIRQGGAELEDEKHYDAIVRDLKSFIGETGKPHVAPLWQRLSGTLELLIKRMLGSDSEIDRLLLQMQAAVADLSLLGKVPEQKIDGTLQQTFGNLEELKNLLAGSKVGVLDDTEVKRVLELLGGLKTQASGSSVAHIEQAIRYIHIFVEKFGITDPIKDILWQEIRQVQFQAGVPLAETEKRPEPQKETPASAPAVPSAKQKSMRIDEWRIDQFLDYVGELLLIEEMYDHLFKRVNDGLELAQIGQDFKKVNDAFTRLSQRLQHSILEVRKIPVKTLFQRAPKIVRDVANENNKDIVVSIFGEELMIDKSLIEAIEAPFVHLLRNAADHGIESAAERTRSGKTQSGTVAVNAVENEDFIFITVEDDGGGINVEKIIQKALALGLISSERAGTLTEKEAYEILFEPGFSTSDKITQVSGRGVGMEVVRHNLKSIGGDVFIESKLGKGTKFTLRFPKSVAVQIIKGFVIAVDGKHYILPLNAIGESFSIRADEVSHVFGKGECVTHHNKVYPVIRLHVLVGSPCNTNNKECVGIIVTVTGNTFVLLVDAILGMTQVVVKDIDGLSGLSPLIEGGAILGDEKVTIVLNPEGLVAKKYGRKDYVENIGCR